MTAYPIFRKTFFVLTALWLAACATLEVGVEPDSSQEGPNALGASSTSGAPGIDRMLQTPTPVPAPIHVAFVKEYNVWLWSSAESQAVPLTNSGDVSDSQIKLSDDGEVIVFGRGKELWMVRQDGTDERKLISAETLAAMEPVDPGVFFMRYDWVPGTHLLAFNTRLRTQYGTTLTDDLHLVDAETLEHTALLPPGKGGEFYYSPDGSQIAVAAAGTISLVDADGSNRRENVLTYAAARTQEDSRYHAEPVWAADGSFLRVAILPADPWAVPAQQTTIWHIPTDGTPGTLIHSIKADPSQSILFSPDLTHVAYLKAPEAALPGLEASDLMVTSLEGGETITYLEAQTRVSSWSPDSLKLATISFHQSSETIAAYIGQPGSAPVLVEVEGDLGVLDLRWIDADRYLLLAMSRVDSGWKLLQGAISSPSAVLASIPDSPGGDVPPFDVARGSG